MTRRLRKRHCAALLLLTTLASPVAYASPRKVVVLASEGVERTWNPSSFIGIATGQLPLNRCEQALADAMQSPLMIASPSEISSQQQTSARSFKPVFGRYNDLSTMPNDTAVRAAKIVDATADTVLACRVSEQTQRPRFKRTAEGTICVSARCKAIDVGSRRRVATAALDRCGEPRRTSDARSEHFAHLCSEMGQTIAQQLVHDSGR